MEVSCRCTELEINRYKNRLSDPFLERIDLIVNMQNVNANDRASMSSADMHREVIEVHKRVKLRGQDNFTAKLSDSDIEKFCVLNKEAKEVLDMAVHRFTLSFRAIKKIQKVARTIADLDRSDTIEKKHVLEALSYRRRGV